MKEGVPVLIAGAGLLGSCIALELARRKMRVVLLDQDPQPMNRASLRNEGKIHLGLIYANDATFDTARLQLIGALNFRRLLKRWIGKEANELRTSTSFIYLVARDSVLTADALARHYSRVEQEYRAQRRSNRRLDYLGTRPETLARKLSKTPPEFAHDFFQAAFATPELAIDTDQLSRLIRRAVRASPFVDFRGNHCVRNIERGGVLRVEGTGPKGRFAINADQVINVTWERRPALDRRIGIAPSSALLHRLKFRVLVRVPAKLKRGPSATMVLGRYGDVVIRPIGLSYLSWYPTGVRGWTSKIEPPRAWDEACRGKPSVSLAKKVGVLALQNIDRWYPGIGKSRIALVDAGAIVALGRTDVDDLRSGLHRRASIGVISLDNYHTIDPGKMTTAPLFAMEAAERVLARAGWRRKGF